jgi:hypothetical protein
VNDVVCPGEDGLRDHEAEGLGGLEVDHGLELRRLLYREADQFRKQHDPLGLAAPRGPCVHVYRWKTFAPALSRQPWSASPPPPTPGSVGMDRP